MIEVVGMSVGELQSNCYLILHNEQKHCVIVDPGADPQFIIKKIDETGCKPVLLINTHGHVDHIGGNKVIKEHYQIPLAIHTSDAQMLVDPEANLSSFIQLAVTSPPADILLNDGDTLDFADTKIEVRHTPGHSPGGISLLIENHLITGDALFLGTIGRTDLPGCSHETLIEAIKSKILSLPDDVIVYPGHGPTTTVGEERQNNPYLQ